MVTHDSFLIQCKISYDKKITPANLANIQSDEYQKLVSIATTYFDAGKINEFAGFFQEGQYFIALWAAHLIVEYSKPDENLKNEALQIIRTYSNNPLAPDVAEEEKEWLLNNISIN